MSDFRVLPSAITDRIYAGRLRNSGAWASGRHDVTDDVRAIVAVETAGLRVQLRAARGCAPGRCDGCPDDECEAREVKP